VSIVVETTTLVQDILPDFLNVLVSNLFFAQPQFILSIQLVRVLNF